MFYLWIAVTCVLKTLFFPSIIRMAQHGLLDVWMENHFLKSKCEDGKRYNSGPILFSHIWLLMAVTVGCLGLCTVVLCLEIIVSLLTYQKDVKSKDTVH